MTEEQATREGAVRTPPLVSAAGWSVATGIVTTLFVFLSSVVIARSLGPSRMGEYAYWMWVIGTVPALFGFGLPWATLKFSAALRGEGKMDLAAALVLALLKAQMVVSGTVAVGLLAVGIFSPSRVYLGLYGLVAALVLFGGVGEILGNAIKGAIDYRFSTYSAVLVTGLQFGSFIVILTAGGGVAALLTVVVGSTAMSTILAVWRFLRLYRPDGRCSLPPELRASIIRYCRSLTGLGLLDAVVWSRSEVFFLGALSGAEQIAFYSLAYGIAGRLIMAATLITHPMLPALSGLYGANDRRRMGQVYRTAMRYVAVLTFPLSIGGFLFAEPLMSLLYTGRYAGAAPALAVTALSSLPGSLTLVCSAALYAIGRPDFLVRLNVWLALADVLASILLIPRYGATGAALANALGPVATVVGASMFLARRYGLGFPVFATAKILVAAAGAVLLARVVIPLTGIAGFLAVGAVGGGLYLVALIVFRVFDHEEDQEVFHKIGLRLPVAIRDYYVQVISALI